jgi:hypothetical protein
MQITIFEEVTTSKVLAAFAEKAESYTDLYVDMNDKEQRRFVKKQAEEINSILKKLNRARIDKTKAAKDSIDDEFNAIVASLSKSNEPFTLLIDEYKAERKRILDAEKAEKARIEAYYQMGMDHEDAIKENELFDLRKEKEKRERATLYWYHAESDACGIATDEDDLMHICNTDGLAEPCSEEVYISCLNRNKEADLAAAEARRLRDIEQAKIDEQNRIKAEQQRAIDEQKKREANRAHVIAICKDAKESLMQQAGLSEADAVSAVKAIRAGLISHCYIKF